MYILNITIFMEGIDVFFKKYYSGFRQKAHGFNRGMNAFFL